MQPVPSFFLHRSRIWRIGVMSVTVIAMVTGMVLAARDTEARALGALFLSVEPRAPERESIATLRLALQAGRYRLLVDRWADAPLAARVRFGQDVAWQGGSMAIAAPLIRDLWLMSSPKPGTGWRLEALRTLYLAYARLRVDGQFCRDESAPGGRLKMLVGEFDALLAYSATLPRSTRFMLIMDALANEAATAASRGPDPFACSGGHQEAAGLLPRELVTPVQIRIWAGLATELGIPGPAVRVRRLEPDP